MHPNPAFRKTETNKNIEFARRRSFGALCVNHEAGPLISHIPFLLSQDGHYLEAHLVRSNPIIRLLDKPVSAALAVSGPDAYISPDWYETENQVPTWNYVAVHLRGTLKRLPETELHPVLSRLSQSLETRLLPKKPWTSDKMDPEVYARMQRQIVPVAMEIEDIQGTWKLSQNKPEKAAMLAADGIERSDPSISNPEIAKLMQQANSDRY